MRAKKGCGPEKKASSHSPRLTVMIVKRVGKARSFRISSRILLWSSVFFVLYLIVSVIVFNKYFDELRLKRHRSEQLKRLAHGIEDTKKTLYRSQQDLVVLRDYIDYRQGRKEGHEQRSQAQEVNRTSAQPRVESESAERVEKGFQHTLVEIKDLSVKKKGTKVKVSFSLVNGNEGKGPVSGYVHLIATNRESDPPQLWTFPKIALRNGVPINYKGGQAFKINRFKTVQGRYFLNTEREFPSSLKILVYNEAGTLILEKEFQVDKSS